MPRRWDIATFLFLPFILIASVGCSGPDSAPRGKQSFLIDTEERVDLLFVIDNSGSMQEEQRALLYSLELFIRELSELERGLPNLHVAVTTTDMGAGSYDIESCPDDGDGGTFRAWQGDCSTSIGPQPYIIDSPNWETGGRDTNYSGTIVEAISCIANVGIDGCGYEQPLEAMRRALDGSNPENQGFLRDDAYLGIVFLTDEDDCSAVDPTIFDSDPALDNAESHLGFLTSFRCFEFGVDCEPNTPREAGVKENCKAKADSKYLVPVEEYVSFLEGLKSDSSKLVVASIAGQSAPVRVFIDSEGRPLLAPSCEGVFGGSHPPIRLLEFVSKFPNQNSTASICNQDLSLPSTLLSEILARKNERCLDGDLVLNNGAPDCIVTQFLGEGDNRKQSSLPECNNGKSNIPCVYFEESPEFCSSTPTHFALKIKRNLWPPPGASVVAECVLQSEP